MYTKTDPYVKELSQKYGISTTNVIRGIGYYGLLDDMQNPIPFDGSNYINFDELWKKESKKKSKK